MSRLVARALRWAARILAGLTSLGLVVPGRAGARIGWAAINLLIAVPLVRVLWLGARWLRRGDRRFAAAAVGLVATVAAGAGVAAALG